MVQREREREREMDASERLLMQRILELEAEQLEVEEVDSDNTPSSFEEDDDDDDSFRYCSLHSSPHKTYFEQITKEQSPNDRIRKGKNDRCFALQFTVYFHSN